MKKGIRIVRFSTPRIIIKFSIIITLFEGKITPQNTVAAADSYDLCIFTSFRRST